MYNQKELEKNLEANCGRSYQQCSVSVMDTIADPNISFDENGVCNYYSEYLEAEKKHLIQGDEGMKKLEERFSKIKEESKNKKYDCILGLSGGVDSTYLCLLAKNYGLNPLVVHFDNGWNSELAQSNIENTLKELDLDLYTHVVNWEEFKFLQLSYLKASVVDIEVLTDHAFMSVLYVQARKWGIKYILAGMNIVTEAILPKYWIFDKRDDKNIKDIYKKHKGAHYPKLKSYPFMSYRKKRLIEKSLNTEVVTPLNWIDFDYETVKSEITDKLKWRDYGGKHYESTWTRFYQGYILPQKFNIDKRKAHLSNLIFSKQIDKAQALNILSKPIIEDKFLKPDYELVLKKFNISDYEFSKIMKLKRREHKEFKFSIGLKHKYLSKISSVIKKNE
jgi:N-acetyl sugar amidotransferase